MGVHVDGYIATAAHTVVVSNNTQEPVTGKTADVIAATYFAYEAALRMLRPGIKVSDINRKAMLWMKILFYFERHPKLLVSLPKQLLISAANLSKAHFLLL